MISKKGQDRAGQRSGLSKKEREREEQKKKKRQARLGIRELRRVQKKSGKATPRRSCDCSLWGHESVMKRGKKGRRCGLPGYTNKAVSKAPIKEFTFEKVRNCQWSKRVEPCALCLRSIWRDGYEFTKSVSLQMGRKLFRGG